jgi:polysaccharide export outer membrane protein
MYGTNSEQMLCASGKDKDSELKPKREPTIIVLLSICGFLGDVSQAVAQAPYRLNWGDSLEVGVASIPEFRHRATIDSDGMLQLPLAGPIDAAGVALPEIRAKIEALLAAKVFYKKTADGRTVGVAISPDEIFVSLVDHRPVYLSGDIARPGEHSYKPGMTVRQAIALAGGVDLVKFRVSNPVLESADLKAEYETLWTEVAKTQMALRRLEAELNGKSDFDAKSLTDSPLSKALLENLITLERAILTARTDDLAKERASLNLSFRQIERRISALNDQKKGEDEGVQADTAEYNRVLDAFNRSILPVTRLTEARRNQLISSTRALQTTAQIAQLEKERDETARKIQRLDDQRRIEVLREMQDAEARVSILRARLQSVSEKLTYSGALKSRFVRGQGGEATEITIHRAEHGEIKHLAANEEMGLLPGDVVEVTLRMASVLEDVTSIPNAAMNHDGGVARTLRSGVAAGNDTSTAGAGAGAVGTPAAGTSAARAGEGASASVPRAGTRGRRSGAGTLRPANDPASDTSDTRGTAESAQPQRRPSAPPKT